MSSVVRSLFGAAVLLTSASAAMAQSATAPVASQAVQPTAAATTVASTTAPVAPQPQKTSSVADKADSYGGHDPNSLAGARAFWQGQNPY